jgi:hypothetical protein
MGFPDRSALRAAVDHNGFERRPPNAAPAQPPLPGATIKRRYEVSALDPSGAPLWFSRILPAQPHLDEAFAAFSRGTLIATADGPVAVEDLVPGMSLQTADAGLRPLSWIGSTMLAPCPGAARAEASPFTRIAADSLGLGRPMPDLVLGPRARMLFRHPGCRSLIGTETAFAPAAAFVDGVSVIALRLQQAMQVYHLSLDGQHVLLANGVEVESYHPGENAAALMDHANRVQFLSLFPHLDRLEAFGRMARPRLTAFETDALRLA